MSVASCCVVKLFQLFQVYLKSHFLVENICYCLQLRLIFSLWTPEVYSSPQYSTVMCHCMVIFSEYCSVCHASSAVWQLPEVVTWFSVSLHGLEHRVWECQTKPLTDWNTALSAYLRKYLLRSYVWYPCHSSPSLEVSNPRMPHICLNSKQPCVLSFGTWYLTE